jgi:hypothetical protein
VIARERTLALGEDPRQPTRPLPKLLDAHQPIAHVALAARRELRLEGDDLGVEPGELGLELAFRLRRLDPIDCDRLQLAAE